MTGEEVNLQVVEESRKIDWRSGASSFQKGLYYEEGAMDIENPLEITARNIRSIDRPNLIRGVAEKNSNGEKFTTEEVKGLICVYVRDRELSYSRSRESSYGEEDVDASSSSESDLPWPDAMANQPSSVTSKPWRSFYFNDETDEGGDALEEELFTAISRLSQQEVAEISLFITNNTPTFVEHFSPGTIRHLQFEATYHLEQHSPESLPVAKKMLELAKVNRDIYDIRWDYKAGMFVEPNYDMSAYDNDPLRIHLDESDPLERHYLIDQVRGALPYVEGSDYSKLFLRAIAQEEDPAVKREFLSRVIANNGLSTTLNNLRELYYNAGLAEEKDKIEELMRPFWKGVVGEDGEFQPDVVALYKAFGYEEYSLTPAETVKRISMLKNVLPKLGFKKGAKVMDLACGVGGLAAGISDEYEVLGIDITPRHIELAQEKYPDLNFQQGSWYELTNIPDAQGVDIVVVDGRSLPHVESLDNFYLVMDQFVQIGAKSAIFTFPNPREGNIGARFDRLKGKLSGYGYSNGWLDRHMYDAIGRLGDTLLHRWLPTEELLILATEASGYEVVEVVKEANYDGKGSENMVFVTKYVEDEFRRRDMALAAREGLSRLSDSQKLTPNKNRAFNHYLPRVGLFQKRRKAA